MRIRRPPLLLLATALALSAAALVHAADDLVQSKFAEYLDALRVQAGIPGLAAAVVGPTSMMWEGAFGQQDVDRNIATRLFTPFQLDDTTQAIVASLAVRCASDGWLSLDDKVSKYKPNSPDASATIGQLLTHTTAGPNGLTFSYRPNRLGPVAAAIAGCTDSSFRWGVGALLEKMVMYDSVPGADVIQLTAPAEAFTASALQRYASVVRSLATPYTVDGRGRATAIVVRREQPDAGVRVDFHSPRSRTVRPVAEIGLRRCGRSGGRSRGRRRPTPQARRFHTPTACSCRTTTAGVSCGSSASATTRRRR